MERPDTYGRAQIALHWIVVLLLAGSFFSHDLMQGAWRALRRGGEVAGTGHLVHVVFGFLILAALAARLLLRRRHGAPAPLPGAPWMARIASLTHAALYFLLALVPLAGIGAWYFGINGMAEAHEILFNLLALVVGLHVAAALYHQIVLKDGILARMAWRR